MTPTWVARGSALAIAVVLAVASASSAVIIPNEAGAPLEAVYALQALVHARFSESHHVEVASGENTLKAGEPYFSDVSHVGGSADAGDVWLLRQRTARSRWHNYGIIVRHNIVYFAVLEGGPRLTGSACVECHPNGPRGLTAGPRAGREEDRAAMNESVGRLGAVWTYIPRAEPLPASARDILDLPPCSECHNGIDRAWLTRQNLPAIRYNLTIGRMPPKTPLSSSEARALSHWMDAR